MIATGARYRGSTCRGSTEFEGTSVYYAATLMEARFCEQQPVVVVGGGNSAGQADGLPRPARRPGAPADPRTTTWAATCPATWSTRSSGSPDVEVLRHTEVRELVGDDGAAARRSSSRTTAPGAHDRLAATAAVRLHRRRSRAPAGCAASVARDERIFKNTFADIEYILTTCANNGTRFEVECYDIGHLYTLRHFADRG